MTRGKNDNKQNRGALRKQHTVKPTTVKTILKNKKESLKKDRSECSACGGSGISYWSDDCYGSCLECGCIDSGDFNDECKPATTTCKPTICVYGKCPECNYKTQYTKKGIKNKRKEVLEHMMYEHYGYLETMTSWYSKDTMSCKYFCFL